MNEVEEKAFFVSFLITLLGRTCMRRVFLFLLCLCAFGFLNTGALAGDSICLLDGQGGASSGMPDCPTETGGWNGSLFVGGKTAIDATWGGLRSNAGVQAKTPVDVFSLCRYVDNHSNEGYFVPFRTQPEWQSFLDNHPTPQLSVTPCAKPFTGINMANGLYFGRSYRNDGMGDWGDDYKPVDLPYWRTGAPAPPSGSYQSTLSMGCYGDSADPYCWSWGTCCDSQGNNCSACCTDSGSVCKRTNYSWQEVFALSLTALNSDGGVAPSWSGSPYRVSGCRPSACDVRCQQNGHNCDCKVLSSAGSCSAPASVDGACGAGSGTSTVSWPSSLCASGLASNQVETTNSYTWNCIGTNGGGTVSCSANKTVVCPTPSLPTATCIQTWFCLWFSNNIVACNIWGAQGTQATNDLQTAIAAGDCNRVNVIASAYTSFVQNIEGYCGYAEQVFALCALGGTTNTQNCMQVAAMQADLLYAAQGISLGYTSPP